MPAGKGDGNVARIINEYNILGGEVLSLEPHLFEFSGLASLERERDKSEVGGLCFSSAEEGFDYGVKTLKAIINLQT